MSKKNKVIFLIMVGGIGQRLRPYTYALPKPLLTANSVSPLENIIKNIKNYGKKEKIYLALGYKKDVFKKWIKSKKIKNIKYVIENKPLGTAGALKKILNINYNNVILINGDLFFKINFKKIIDFHNKKKYDATVCVKKNITYIPYAILEKKKNKLTFKEKPKIFNKINSGIYVIKKGFLKEFFSKKQKKKRDKFDMPELVNSVKKNKLGIFDIGDKWIDIGNIYDFKKASREIQSW